MHNLFHLNFEKFGRAERLRLSRNWSFVVSLGTSMYRRPEFSQPPTVVAMVSIFAERIAHSQTTATRQPSARRSSTALPSRATVAANFSLQNSWFEDGTAASLQSLCRCQKHPCTKTAASKRGSKMSGRPGKSRACRRYRNPSLCSRFRRSNSGLVSRPRMPDIILERVALSTMSTIQYSGVLIFNHLISTASRLTLSEARFRVSNLAKVHVI